MIRRAFAAALLVAATACSDLALGGDAALVGAWGTDEAAVQATLPNGSTHAAFGEAYRFFPDGTFTHRLTYRDLDSPRSWTGIAEEGTWRVSGDVLVLRATRRFAAAPQDAQENPTLADVAAPEDQRFSYSFVQSELLLGGWCPSNAICEILPRRFHPLLVAM